MGQSNLLQAFFLNKDIKEDSKLFHQQSSSILMQYEF